MDEDSGAELVGPIAVAPPVRRNGSGEPAPVPAELIRAELWDRLRGESRQAFQAFQAYRDLGPGRSQVKAGEAVGKGKALMETWSRKHHWRARTLAFDDALDRDRQLALRSQALDLASTRMRTEGSILETVPRELGKHLEGRAQADLPGMTPTEAAKLLTATAQVAKATSGPGSTVKVGTIEQAVFAVAERKRDPRMATD